MAQTYSSPLPLGAQIRYSQTGFTRQTRRRLRRLERRRRLGQQHRRRHVQQHGAQRGAASRPDQHQDPRRAERARRPPAVREHRRPARGAGRSRWTRAGAADRSSGSPRSARRRRSSARTSSRRTSTRTTGASWRCATACARPTTAARRAAGACSRRHGTQRARRAEHELRVALSLDDQLGLSLADRLGGLLPRHHVARDAVGGRSPAAIRSSTAGIAARAIARPVISVTPVVYISSSGTGVSAS